MEMTLTTGSEHGAYNAAAKYFVAWLLSVYPLAPMQENETN